MADAVKPAAIDLFIGIQSDPTLARSTKRSGYHQWFRDEHLNSPYTLEACRDGINDFVERSSDFWMGYYIRKMGVLLFPTFCAFITFFEGKK